MTSTEFDHIIDEIHEYEREIKMIILRNKLESLKGTPAIRNDEDLSQIFSSYDFNTPDFDHGKFRRFCNDLGTSGYLFEMDQADLKVDQVGYEMKLFIDPQKLKIRIFRLIADV